MFTLSRTFVAAFAVWRKRGASFGAVRAASRLLSLLLVMQVAGAGAHIQPMAPPEASQLASLGSVLGHPVSLCRHGAPDEPTSPDHNGHCDVCCLLDASVALVPPGAVVVGVGTSIASVERPLAAATASLGARYTSASSPRGPPTLA